MCDVNTINHNKQIIYVQAYKGGLNITREDVFKRKLNISKPPDRSDQGVDATDEKQLRPKTCSNEHFSEIHAEKFSLTCYTIMITALIHTLSALIY